MINHLESILAISLTTVGFICFYFIIHSEKLRQKFVSRYGEDSSLSYWFYFRRSIGMFLFGIVLLLVNVVWLPYQLSDYGVASQNWVTTLIWTFGLSAIIIPMNAFASRNPKNLIQYPEIRTQIWTKNILFWSAITWIGYLLAYEFMFRGVLLFACERAMGVELAITINVAIYAFFHIHKGLREAIGAIPLGIVLCLLTLKTGTIWIAFFVHVVLSLSNEWFSLKYHPKIRVLR